MTSEDAEILADALVWADLRGVPQQGTAMKIPQCLARLDAGGTRADAELVTVSESAGVAVLDAQDGWGQVAATRAMRIAVNKARALGIGAVVVRNSTYAGMLGYHPMTAVMDRMIGLAINNTYPLQAPWGGTTKAIGNQAFAIGCPAGKHFPLLFDAATTAISLARIHDYEAAGISLPPGVALDERGDPTVDPLEAFRGTLLSMGGHRGSGLALMWEVLTGVLAGGDRFSTEVSAPGEHGRRMSVSIFVLAIDPRISMPIEGFLERVDSLIDTVHASAPVEGVDRVLVPGERGFLLAADRERDGIPLPVDGLAQIRAAGADLGVRWDLTS
jgi:LDH2 family malate/lactate/ureidoglycolate dehydrogenase